jgi:hypothetical protein
MQNNSEPGFFASIAKLPVFSHHPALPQTDAEIQRTLESPLIRRLRACVLGPEGTNLVQASHNFHSRMGVSSKVDVVFCSTPEEAIRRAEEETTRDTLGEFWTCAVYVREYQVFFENPTKLPFVFQHIQPLDEMQLAATTAVAAEIANRSTRPPYRTKWRIASHPSPAPLLKGMDIDILEAKSNGDAAFLCAAGDAECCITTETARALHGLVKVKSFGSPNMVFFGGVSAEGANLLSNAFVEAGALYSYH